MQTVGDEAADGVPTDGAEVAEIGEPELAERNGADWPWLSAAVWTAVTLAFGLTVSLFVYRLVADDTAWFQAGDLWVHLRAASYVSNGAPTYVYEAHPMFVAMPGYAVALAPVSTVVQALQLVEGSPRPLPQPSAWLPLLTWALCLSFPLYLGIGRLAAVLGTHARMRIALQGLMLPLVVVPAGLVMGHYEDVLLVGFAALALADIREERWIRAAWMLAIALSVKQLALLAFPLMLLQVPREVRARWAVHCLALPALLVMAALLTDWQHAAPALLHAPTFPRVGHALPWTPDVRQVTAGPVRLLSVLSATVLAVWAGRLRTRQALAGGLALVLVARLPGELVWHAYYLSPILAFALVHAAVAQERVWLTALLGLLSLAWFGVHPPAWLWLAVACLLLATILAPSVRDIVRGRSPQGELLTPTPTGFPA